MLAGNSANSPYRTGPAGPTSDDRPESEERRVPTADALLRADLTIPARAGGVVVIAEVSARHGTGPPSQALSDSLIAARIAVLRLQLLGDREPTEAGGNPRAREEAERLGRRVVAAIDWLNVHRELRGLPVGCFGQSTGAAATLCAAAERSDRVRAVVGCAGRPDFADDTLARVTAATLLIVARSDGMTYEHNRRAARLLGGEARLRVVPGAGLLGAPMAGERISTLSAGWFSRRLGDACDVRTRREAGSAAALPALSPAAAPTMGAADHPGQTAARSSP